MREITFRQGAMRRVLERFDMSVNEEGLVVRDSTGKPVTDAFGVTVEMDNVGGIVNLESHGMTVNEEGRVLDIEGNPVSVNFDDEGYNHTEALVHIEDEVAILRSVFPCSTDFAEAKKRYQEVEEE